MPTIRLRSSDGVVIETDEKIVKCSGTIKNLIQDLRIDKDEDVVPLPNVNSAMIQKVLQWANYHKDNPVIFEGHEDKEKRLDDISTWDRDFLNVLSDETLLELTMAANYLDVKGLLQLICKIVASRMIGKTPDELRKTFNIQADLSAHEEEEIRKQHKGPKRN